MERLQQPLRAVGVFLGYAAVSALLALPIAVEQSLETAHFADRVGTFPVDVALSHNGVSTFDTGLMGKLYWDRTGFGGFGASITSTGPPEAGGTLSSYVAPAFLRANAAFVDDPDEVARVYGAELQSQVVGSVLRIELVVALAGGLLLLALFRGQAPPVPGRPNSRRLRVGIQTTYLAAGVAGSVVLALGAFAKWEGTAPIDASYPMPGIDGLSFSSPQTVEVAQQIQPFVEKNTTRIAERARVYRETAAAEMETQIALHAAGIAAKEGEVVVIAEADPQGSNVATEARSALYPLLQEALGEETIVARTISGDISSNGTVAEEGFVRSEAAVSPGIPVIAVKGDHDSETTVEQMEDNDVPMLDVELLDEGGLRFTGAADPAFKALFGGLVVNDSGISESDIGEQLRELVDDEEADEPVVVVLHQPRAAAAYLGIGSTGDLRASEGRETTPYDDGITDVPPGTVNIGHLHDVSGPWVIWNTDGDETTWTVVNQLGTSGGVEENPTFNRFSTPFSTPLKAVSVELQYLNSESGLQTGYAEIVIAPNGTVTVTDRVDLGLPGGLPVPTSELVLP